MMKTLVVAFLLAACIAATSYGEEEPNQIFPLRLKSGSGPEGATVQGITCASWLLAEEVHNIIEWTFPEECLEYIGNYLLGQQYRDDSKAVNREAYFYARSLPLPRDGRNIWIVDIDETALSNLPYFTQSGFGAKAYNTTGFYEFLGLGISPALPETLKLYNKLLNLGIKIVFLTGRGTNLTNATVANLKREGYHTWHKLILKDTTEYGDSTAAAFKSAEREKLVKQGYRIVGNIGDQWSDILGTHPGRRTFKLPNPIYYVS